MKVTKEAFKTGYVWIYILASDLSWKSCISYKKFV